MAGPGNVRPAGHMRPAKHTSVAHEPFFIDASFEKMDCLMHIFSQKSYQIGIYCTYAGPHLPILFPMWPISQKELPTPGLGGPWTSYPVNQFVHILKFQILYA